MRNPEKTTSSKEDQTLRNIFTILGEVDDQTIYLVKTLIDLGLLDLDLRRPSRKLSSPFFLTPSSKNKNKSLTK